VSADEVAICVGRLAYKLANGQERPGFCSSWLTNLQQWAGAAWLLLQLAHQPAAGRQSALQAHQPARVPAAPQLGSTCGHGGCGDRLGTIQGESDLIILIYFFDWEEKTARRCAVGHPPVQALSSSLLVKA
jgi:hypothetical protein